MKMGWRIFTSQESEYNLQHFKVFKKPCIYKSRTKHVNKMEMLTHHSIDR